MNPISFKTEIFFEDDAITDMAAYSGERILVVTSGQGAEYAPAKRLLRAAENNGNKIRVFNGILPDPPLSVIADGVGIVKEFNPTVILALGGGSALDGAKAMKADSDFKGDFIAVPTTSGTGSEVNDLAVVTEDVSGLKLPKLDDRFQPKKAYLIAELTATMPQNVTVDTGMDVLTHAVEAYVAKPFGPFYGYTDITDAMAEKAVSLVFEFLPKVYQDPNDLNVVDHKIRTPR